jgi:hypothetical protein
MWYSVATAPLNQVTRASPVVPAPGYVSVIMYSSIGLALASVRTQFWAASVMATSYSWP